MRGFDTAHPSETVGGLSELQTINGGWLALQQVKNIEQVSGGLAFSG